MEFHITATGALPDPGNIEDAIREFDPAAVVDVDASGRTLRVAAAISAAELVGLVNQAGWPVSPDQVRQLPSICCGGCSG